MIRAGALNNRLMLQRPANTRGSAGALIEGYEDVATVWGAVEPAGGREGLESGKITTEMTHRLRIRFRADVKATWRVKWSDPVTSPPTLRYFRLVSVLAPYSGREELHLMAQELPNGEPA